MSDALSAPLRAAIHYADAAGWFVFPIHPVSTPAGDPVCGCYRDDCDKVGKHPILAGGGGNRWGSTNDPDQLRSYWSDNPYANVGVDCEASGLVVLDLDYRQRDLEDLDGPKLFRNFCDRERHDRRHGSRIDPDADVWATLTQVTPTGGQHLVFRAGENRIRSGNWHHMTPRQGVPTGVDLKACGGMFVVSPSRHRSMGHYRWVDDVFDPERVLPLPDWLASLLPRQGGRNNVTGGASTVNLRDRLGKGERHTALVSLTGSMRNRGLTAEEALPAVLAFNLNRCDPPMPDREVEAIVRDVCGRYDPVPPVPDWASDLTARTNGHGKRAPEYEGRLVAGGDWALDEPEEIPALWGEGERVLWAEGEGLMINGHQGTGKTTLGQQLVLHRLGVRTGDFLGLPVKVDDRPVFYLAMDRPRQAARSMRRMLASADRQVVNERLRVWRGPLPFNLLADPHLLADWAQEKVPDLGTLVLDSAKDLAPGISKDEVGAAINMAWQEVIARGVELLVLHHQRKAEQGAKREWTLDSVYGSTWLTSGLGSVLIISGEPGDVQVGVRHVKQPAAVVGPLQVRHEHQLGRSVVLDGVPSVLELVAGAGEEGVTAWDVALALYGSDEDRYRRRAIRELGHLEDRACIRRVEGVKAGAGRSRDRWVVTDVWKAAGQL